VANSIRQLRILASRRMPPRRAPACVAVRERGGTVHHFAKGRRFRSRAKWCCMEELPGQVVKRLAAEGYATAKRTHAGSRRRTVYAITAAGRKALRRWLAEPVGNIRLEAEPLLKVFFADQGEVTDLLATIRAIGDNAERQQAALRRLALDYRDGAVPFPERLPIGVLALGLVFEQLEATIVWSRRAQDAVAGWPPTSPGGSPLWPVNIFSSLQSGEDDGSRQAGSGE